MAHVADYIKRCYYCNKIIMPSDIRNGLFCPCGSRRTRVAFGITPEEEALLKEDGYDCTDENWAGTREEAWKD